MKPQETENGKPLSPGNTKPSNIKNQYNANCQQFFGPVYGATFNMAAATPPQRAEPQSGQDIRAAIEALYEATTADGQRLFTDQSQWYAVYRVLKEYCNYPATMTDFVRTMNDKGLDSADPRCQYESVKKVIHSCPKLTCKPTLWGQYAGINESYGKQCRVAAFLLEKLGYGA